MSDLKAAAATGAASVSGAGMSFFVKTLPIVQWCSAAVAVLAGLVTISIGMIKLHSWLRSRKP